MSFFFLPGREASGTGVRTRREDVNEEATGNDGILDNFMRLARELNILHGRIMSAMPNKKPMKRRRTSEDGEVILIPYVFSMMFLPSALQKKARGQNACKYKFERDASHTSGLHRCNCLDAQRAPAGAVVRPTAGSAGTRAKTSD